MEEKMPIGVEQVNPDTTNKKRKSNAKAKRAAEKKHKKTSLFTSVMAVLIVFLAFYLAISLFVAGLILYSFNDTAKNTEIYSLSVFYDNHKLYSLDADEANNQYGLYVPFEYLAEISSFGLAGDGDDITLFIIGTDNRIKCTKNSSLIVINNNPIRISSPLLYEDGEYLIPVTLIENYVNGIDVSYDTEKMVCYISSDTNKADVALKLLLPEDMSPADFPDSYKYYGEESDNSVPEE